MGPCWRTFSCSKSCCTSSWNFRRRVFFGRCAGIPACAALTLWWQKSQESPFLHPKDDAKNRHLFTRWSLKRRTNSTMVEVGHNWDNDDLQGVNNQISGDIGDQPLLVNDYLVYHKSQTDMVRHPWVLPRTTHCFLYFCLPSGSPIHNVSMPKTTPESKPGLAPNHWVLAHPTPPQWRVRVNARERY